MRAMPGRSMKARLLDRLRGWLPPSLFEWLPGGSAKAPPDAVLGWRSRLPLWPPPAPPLDEPVGVFVHLFYPDMADQIAAAIAAIPADLRVYVTTDTDDKSAQIAARFERFGLGGRTQIRLVQNRGWDIAPFLLGFDDAIRRHPLGIKLHGKRSTHQPASFGNAWRGHLLSELVGDGDRARIVLDSFAADPKLGVIMAQHWRGLGPQLHVLGPNHAPVQAVLARGGLSIAADEPVAFPSGSMFWFRREAIVPLLDLGLTWDDFDGFEDFVDADPQTRDASLAHGVERSFLVFCASAGLRWAVLPRRRRWSPLLARLAPPGMR